MNKAERIIIDLKKAVNNLEVILAKPINDIHRDAAIKRFELAYELSWKALKQYISDNHGIVCVSPKQCFKEAFSLGVLEYEEKLLELVTLRNYTIHTYNEQLARKVYGRLPETVILFRNILAKVD